MLFILTLLLSLLFSLLINSLFRHSFRLVYFLGLYIISLSSLILISEIAGIICLLSSKLFWLTTQSILVGLAWYIWQRAGKPSLLWPIFNSKIEFKTKIIFSFKKYIDLWIFGFGVGLIYFVGAWLIMTVAPNTGDSMGTYLARIGYWLQNSSLYPWQTQINAQIMYPINPDVLKLWTVLFWGNDQLVGYIQWISVIMAIPAIIGLGQVFGFSSAQSVFAALIWATFPQIVLQSTSTQTDVAFSSLLVIMIYLLYLGIKVQSKEILLLSSLTLGLLFGTKQFVFMIIPGLMISIFMIWLSDKKKLFKPILFWTTCGILAILLIGAYTYIQNLIYFGSIGGPGLSKFSYIYNDPTRTPGLFGYLHCAVVNLCRYFYQLADTRGLPLIIGDPILKFKSEVAKHVFNFLGLPVASKLYVANYVQDTGFLYIMYKHLHEHNAWYGPLGFLMLLPSSLLQFWYGLKNRDYFRIGILLMCLCVLFFQSIKQWGGVEGRYLMIIFTLCAPFMSICFQSSFLLYLGRLLLIFLALLVLNWTMLNNILKPLIGRNTIWGMDRISQQTIYWHYEESTVRMIEKYIPFDATVGFINYPAEYFLFGKEFKRTIIPIVEYNNLKNKKWLAEKNIDYILVNTGYSLNPKELGIPSDFGLIGKSGYYSLLARGAEGDFNNWDKGLKQRLTSVTITPDDAPFFSIDQALSGQVGICPGFIRTGFGLEKAYNKPGMWLGFGESYGLEGVLWCDAPKTVFFDFAVEPGPVLNNPERTVALYIENNKNTININKVFDRPTTISFIVHFETGRNMFRFYALDKPINLKKDYGDSRPLLVFLNQVKISLKK